MCGRYALNALTEEIAQNFAPDSFDDFKPRFNIPPTIKVPAIRQTLEGKRVLNLLRWGLVAIQWPLGALGNHGLPRKAGRLPNISDRSCPSLNPASVSLG